MNVRATFGARALSVEPLATPLSPLWDYVLNPQKPMAEHQRKAAPPPRLPGARFLVVEARYYDDVGEMLMQGARAAFAAAGADFDVIGVPDALEIPAAIAIANDARPYDSTMALGCVIRGEAYYKDRCRASRGDNPIPTCARSPAEKNSI